MKSKLILITLLLNIYLVYSQKTVTETVSYNPSNGFQMNVPFKAQFIDCHNVGVRLAIERMNREVTSSGYYYKNKLYTSAEIGASHFRDMKSYIGTTNIIVDIYFSVNRVGTTDLNNITGASGCAFGTYDVLKKLGNGKEYAKKIGSLSIRSFRDIKINNRHPGIEADIEDYLKNNQIEKLLNEGNDSFNREYYDSAEDAYRNVLKLDYSNFDANKRLEEIKELRRNELKKKEFESFISDGAYYYKYEQYPKAIEYFKQALNTGFDDELAISEIDKAKAKLEEIANNENPETEEGKNPEIGKEPNKEVRENLTEKKPLALKATKKEADESMNKEDSSDSQSRYNTHYSQKDSYNQLVNFANRMRANGQAGTPAYNRTMQSIRELENRLGLGGPNSYSSQATINDMANATAQLLSYIPEADSYTSTIGLSYSLNYVNNINLVFREGWVWGHTFLDMKFAGVVVPTEGWEDIGEFFTRSELQDYTNNNEVNPLDIVARYSDSYSYYKYNQNLIGYGGGMGLTFGFTFPVAKSIALRIGATADAELTNLYIKSAYGIESEFYIGKWLIGLGYQTSDYFINDKKVIFNNPELIFSDATTYGLKTLSNNDQIDSYKIKNHFVIKLGYAW